MEKLDVAIIASKKDMAGMNIAEQLQQMQTFPAVIGSKRVDLFLRDEHITEADNVDREIDAEVFIFASRHVSKAGVHSLSVHSIGNWGKAFGGGQDKTLVRCPAALMKSCLKLLMTKADKIDYEVIQEATHHGPYLEKPVMFIEIGSDEEHWKDEKAGKVVAATIIEALKIYDNRKIKTVIGLGGPHYASNFGRVLVSEDVAISYLCPKYLLETLDESMLRQAMQKSIPKAESVVLDWKGLGQEKDRIVKLLDKLGIPYKKTREYAAVS